MKLLILANCQAVALSKISEKIMGANGEPLFQILSAKPVYEMTKKEQPHMEQLLQQCDVLLYQPHIKHKFTPEWRTSDYWVANTSAKHTVSFQSLFFSAYNPELTYVRDALGRHLNEGFVDYHDKRILKLFLQDKSSDEIADFFTAIQPVKTDIALVLAETLKEMKDRELEQNLDVRVSKFVENNFRKERLFYTYNHPSNAVLYEVVRQLLVITGHAFAEITPVKKELLRFDYFPISPAVEKFLDLDFSDNQDEYLIQGKKYNQRDLVNKYLEIYQNSREWISNSALDLESENWLNRKKLLLHIGYSKSGTTSFQSQAFNNRNQLLSAGVLYPKAGVKFTNHAFLAMHYQGAKRDDALITQLKEEITNSEASTTLISCEAFEGLSSAQIEEFFRDFGEFDIVVICQLRDRLSWAASMYAEYVRKAWYQKSFDDLLQGLKIDKSLYYRLLCTIKLTRKEYNISRHFSRLLSDKTNLQPWIEQLPKDNFLLLNSPTDDLWQKLEVKSGANLKAVIPDEPKVLNESPSVMAVELSRRFYSQHNVRDLFYPAAVMFLRRVDKELAERGVDVSVNTPFTSRDSVADFLTDFINDDLWLEGEYGFNRMNMHGVEALKYFDPAEADQCFDDLGDDMEQWFLDVKSKFKL